nr:DUF551 domain-containing protein [Klebsiella pneumoniae]
MPPAQPAPEYPEALPCPVLLEPGLRFGKGIKTSTMLAALARRAVYESDMAALSPEERVEFQSRIEDFKALIAQPAPVVPGKWIPVSERLPENKPGSYEYLVFETLNNRVNHDYWNVPDKGDDAFTPFWNYYGGHVTHWMPMPAAPQEVRGE